MSNTQKIWLPERKEGMIAKFVAFLISPVLGILTSILRPNTKSSYLVLLLSFMTIGLTIIIPADRTEEKNFDSITYRQQFEDYTTYATADFATVLFDYSQMDEDSDRDIYSRMLYFVVSRFTDNYHVCFMIIAFVFAFFMLKALRYLVSDEHYSVSILCLLLLFLFTLCQIQQINAFRFYTAYWIALYALFKIIMDEDKRYWILLAITPAVHASYFIVFFIYLLYYFMQKNHKAAVIIVVAGLLFSSIAVQVISWIILHLPASLGGHYSEYINEWYIQEINEGGSGGLRWLGKLLELVVRVSINVIGLWMAYKYKSNIADTKYSKAYFFMLAVLAFANFTFMIPSVGSRYVMFFFPFLAYVWLGCFSQEKQWNWVIYSFSAIYLLYFLVLSANVYQFPCLRYYFMLWDLDVLYQSPIYLSIKYFLFPPA